MRRRKPTFPFDEPENVAVFTTSRVLFEGYPVLLVHHADDDGSWSFLCGTTNADEHLRIIGLREAWEMDESIGKVADLPLGWRANGRDITSPGQGCRGEPAAPPNHAF